MNKSCDNIMDSPKVSSLWQILYFSNLFWLDCVTLTNAALLPVLQKEDKLILVFPSFFKYIYSQSFMTVAVHYVTQFNIYSIYIEIYLYVCVCVINFLNILKVYKIFSLLLLLNVWTVYLR